MKKKNTTLVIGGALVAALVLIVGSNILSGEPVVSDVDATVPEPPVTTSAPASKSPVATIDNVDASDADDVAFAPDFSLTSLKGDVVTLSDYRGLKPVVLDFFATWCPNCQRAMPKLSKMYEIYQDDVVVIGINLREDESDVRTFVDQKNIVFPIVIDAQSTVSRAYGVRYTNYHVLINKDGSLADVVPGDMSEQALQDLITANQ